MNTLDEIKIVIGSWGSYNECNERALGSKWLTLSDYSSWEEIEDELKKQGFELNGSDKELFIQDIEGSGVLEDSYKYEVMQAYLEVRCFEEWKDLVNSRGNHYISLLSLSLYPIALFYTVYYILHIAT